MSGILDTPKKSLNPNLWNEYKLKPNFRKFILTSVSELLQKYGLKLRNILFYGGNAGYQWNPQSDIDISLYTNVQPVEYEELLKKFKNIESEYMGHPVHFYLKSPNDSIPVEISEAVYDICKDDWIVEPYVFPEGFDPDEYFRREIVKANSIAEEVGELLDIFYNAVEENDVELINQMGAKIVWWLETLRTARNKLHEDLRKKYLTGTYKPTDRFAQAEINWKYLDKMGLLTEMSEVKELLY